MQPYDRYRNRLASLATDNFLLPQLDKSSAEWRRIYGRFLPPEALGEDYRSTRKPYVTMLYERTEPFQQLLIFEIYEHAPYEGCHISSYGATETQNWLQIPELGWVRKIPFPHDPKLITLSDVMHGLSQPTVVRYRPGKRCTIRHQHEMGDEKLIRYSKVFPDMRGLEIHQEIQGLWEAFINGLLDFEVAKPLFWNGSLRMQQQAAIVGQPIARKLHSPQGAKIAKRLGRAAASIPNSSLRPNKKGGVQKQFKRTTKNVARLGRIFPALEPLLHRVMTELSALHRAAGEEQVRPIHGAPHAKQWLDNGRQLGLVDFDGFCLGPPELDVATFVTEVEFENRKWVPVDMINTHFLQAYESVVGPLNKELLTAYCIHKRISKAQRHAFAIRTDNDQRVHDVLKDTAVILMNAMN